MNNVYIWLILLVVSAIFGFFSRIAAYKIKVNKEIRGKIKKLEFESGSAFWFFEVWRDFVSYFITGAIGYFIVAIRWPEIAQSNELSVKDFVLCLAFFIGVLGWWPYFIKNITEGINAIIGRILKK